MKSNKTTNKSQASTIQELQKKLQKVSSSAHIQNKRSLSSNRLTELTNELTDYERNNLLYFIDENKRLKKEIAKQKNSNNSHLSSSEMFSHSTASKVNQSFHTNSSSQQASTMRYKK